jgi:tetratricopeptide (TPR) repeat protein
MASAANQGVPGANGKEMFHDPSRLRLILCLMLALVTIVLYNPISHAPFLNYDDNSYVTENFHVRAGLTWNTVVWAFTTNAESNWHPLTWISHALDVQLFGLNPAGPHYVNVLLHATNVLLLFLILEAATKFTWRSFVVAALFAVHPINVESVAWIAERKNVLSMLFFLCAIAAYGWYARKPAIGRYVVVAVCFALGLMAKPQVITLPFLLLLLDYWPLERIATPQSFPIGLFLEKIPLFLLAAGSAWMTMKAQAGAMHVEYPLTVRLENAAISYLKYIGDAFWPAGLAALYPHPGLSVNALHALLAALALAVITLLAILSWHRYFFVGWLWFLGALVPMIGLVQVGVQARADRYAYIPLLGIFVVACWGSADLFKKLRVPAAVPVVVAGIAIIALAVSAHRQIAYWKDNLTLWTHTLEVTHNNFLAEDSLATALVAQGSMDDAATHFEAAIKINPSDPIATINLGVYDQLHQNYSAAVARYETIPRLTQNPRLRARALTNQGYVYYSLKNYDRAQQSFAATVQESPENPQALLGLGLVAQMSGQWQEAVENYARAVRLSPSDVGYLLLAQALEHQGRGDDAKAAQAAAEQISRNVGAASSQVQRLLAP